MKYILGLTANAESKERCQLLIKPIRDEILNRVGTYYFGSDEVNIEESVINSAKQNFAIYDGVTNGALFTRLKMLTVKI